MSFEPVDLTILDDTISQNPVEGAVVRLFDSTGTTPFGQAITDVNGVASFLLPAPATYQARFYKSLVSFTQPQLLDVQVAPATNEFSVSGHVFAPPEAVDPRLCRCSGYFVAPNGAALPNVDIHIIAKFDPILFQGKAVMGERIRLTTDADGYVQVDLIRFGQYEITVQGIEDCVRIIHVPDQPSANLPDMIFAVVAQVTFDPPGPYSFPIGVDNEIVVTPTAYASDGRKLDGTAIEDIAWSTEDASIAVVLPSDKTLTLRGLSSGTTSLLASRLDPSIIRIPDPPIVGVPVPLTVT